MTRMKPKEKAKELVDKYSNFFANSYPDVNKSLASLYAEDMLKELDFLMTKKGITRSIIALEMMYWGKVNNEINKLK